MYQFNEICNLSSFDIRFRSHVSYVTIHGIEVLIVYVKFFVEYIHHRMAKKTSKRNINNKSMSIHTSHHKNDHCEDNSNFLRNSNETKKKKTIHIDGNRSGPLILQFRKQHSYRRMNLKMKRIDSISSAVVFFGLIEYEI